LLADGKVSALAWASMSRAAKVLGATRFEQRDEIHPLLLGRIADWRASSQALAAVQNFNQANVALGSKPVSVSSARLSAFTGCGH
jgi:hypothetical protein